MKKLINITFSLSIFLSIMAGSVSSLHSQPVVDSIKYQDSLNIHKISGNTQMMYGIIYLKNTSTAYDTVFVHKYTQKGTLVKSGVVNLDSSGIITDRIILPPDNKYHTYGINHIYPGAIYIYFYNVVVNKLRRIDYEINYYAK